MNKKLSGAVMQLSVLTMLLTACSKKADILTPQPPPVTKPEEGFFPIQLKAAITVGDVVYDSIPATFTITSWDANGLAQRKDTALDAGARVIYLPKNAVRYSLKLSKWGVTEEKMLNKADVVEGALYQLGGHKEAKKLQWLSEYKFENGVSELSNKQHFVYDAQGRINEVHHYAQDPNNGVLHSASSDIFLYGGNELWVNSTSKTDGTVWSHNVYTFDAQGRTIQSENQILTQHSVYTIQYTTEGIMMLAGKNATDPNGSRIALRFAGGNRVEEKTVIPGYSTSVKHFRYDFNINPFVLIKMPGLYFEHSSKNNVIAEGWEGSDRFINEYKYSEDGYITEVTTKSRHNNGQLVNYSRTVYTY
jgi:hypothetical protein